MPQPQHPTAAHISALVATAPPLDPATAARIRALLGLGRTRRPEQAASPPPTPPRAGHGNVCDA